LRSALRQLRSIAQPGSLWCGEAGRAFSAKLAEPSEAHLDEVPARYEGYAAALSSYAAQVDEAHRYLVAAQSAAADAVRAYGVIVARPGAPPSAAVRGAEQACLLAAGRYKRGYDQWVADINRCVDRLAVVDDTDHLHNPHGWHAAVDAAARVFGDVSTITAVLGVVALAACPRAYGRALGRAYRNDVWREPAQAVQEARAAGGALRPATRPMAARFRDNVDELGSVGASCVQDTVDHRDEGYVRAGVRSPARVAWTPIADLAG
jgi:uncharacterized protein YukE